MWGTGLFHIVRFFRADVEQESGRLAVDETCDAFVHRFLPGGSKDLFVCFIEIRIEKTMYVVLQIVDVLFPAVLLCQSVQWPESQIVALCRDNRLGIQ